MKQGYQKERTLLYMVSGISLVLLFTWLALSTTTPVYADESVVDEVNITVPSSCTFGVGGGGTYNIELDNGEDDVVTANNITVSCNDISGYAIYAIGFSGDSYYGTNTDLIHESDTSYNIKTDGTGTYGSSWKMKLTAVSNATIEGNYATAWQNIPSTYVKVASFSSNTTESVITPQYQITISNTQMAGTYTGKVKYTLVHPNTAPAPMMPLNPSLVTQNKICYAPNAPDVQGDMSSLGTTTELQNASPTAGITSVYANSTTNLMAPNFYRPGYGFAGWSTDFEATSESKIYGPNETISTNPNNGGVDVSSGLILYPVWVASSGNLQGWNGCSSLTATNYDSSTATVSSSLDNIIALTDTRDNNTYAVAKLADGKCWMIENLRLDAEHSRGVDNVAKAQGYGQSATYGNFIGLADSEDENFTEGIEPVPPNSLYSPGGNTAIDIGDDETTWAEYRMPRYNNNNTNMATNATNSAGTTLQDSRNDNNDHVRWYSYGNYYTWAAAKASTILYDDTSANYSDNVNTSICPTGWRLPLGSTSTGTLANGENDANNRVGSFSYLDRKMGGNGKDQSSTAATNQSKKWRSFPNNFTLSGNWVDNSATQRGMRGMYYTSSTNSISSSMIFLIQITNTIRPGTGNVVKPVAATIRCIAQ